MSLEKKSKEIKTQSHDLLSKENKFQQKENTSQVTHEDRMKRAPIDGRVSVPTGRRLVGSTVARRLLGNNTHVQLKPTPIRIAGILIC